MAASSCGEARTKLSTSSVAMEIVESRSATSEPSSVRKAPSEKPASRTQPTMYDWAMKELQPKPIGHTVLIGVIVAAAVRVPPATMNGSSSERVKPSSSPRDCFKSSCTAKQGLPIAGRRAAGKASWSKKTEASRPETNSFRSRLATSSVSAAGFARRGGRGGGKAAWVMREPSHTSRCRSPPFLPTANTRPEADAATVSCNFPARNCRARSLRYCERSWPRYCAVCGNAENPRGKSLSAETSTAACSGSKADIGSRLPQHGKMSTLSASRSGKDGPAASPTRSAKAPRTSGSGPEAESNESTRCNNLCRMVAKTWRCRDVTETGGDTAFPPPLSQLSPAAVTLAILTMVHLDRRGKSSGQSKFRSLALGRGRTSRCLPVLPARLPETNRWT
mmetsp:Transcript_109505/g.349327  ORF Transcript_109505/g.349327 Transcript_109505/m.349327 type:complete len:392 (+) Transcript_109505:1091-2266(+)